MTNIKKPLISYGWLRATTGFISFLILYISISLLSKGFTDYLSTKYPAPERQVGNSSGELLKVVIIVNFTFFLTVYLFTKFIDRRPVASLGLKWKRSDALIGFLTATTIIGAGTLMLWAINDLKFKGATFDPTSLLFNLFIFCLVAFGEELFFRGYLLNNLLQSSNKWLALGISALFFTFLHIQNPGATSSFLPVLSVFTGGLLFGVNYIYTRNLWFSICLHFTWNFLQGPVLGYDVSGTTSQPILKHTLSGNPFITGGAFGFEGSIFCILLSLIAMIVLVLLKKKH